MKKTYLITATVALLFSCGKENKETETKVETKTITNTVKDVVSNTVTKVKNETKKDGNYISKKFNSTKEIFVDSDSIINNRKNAYFAFQKKQYPEYTAVQKWFESNPKELLNLKGDYYKMLKGAVLDEGTISHIDLTAKSEYGTYKYLYITEKAYCIYDLAFTNNKVVYKSVRRIQKGFGKEPMHDLVFNKQRDLEKEVFQGEVKQDLFTKNGHIYFEYEKKVNGNSVTNTIDLGTERNF